MSYFTHTGKSKKATIIVIVALLVVVLSGAGLALYFQDGTTQTQQVIEIESPTDRSATAVFQEKLKEQQAEVTKLVTAGDQESISKATELVEKSVKTAQSSGDDQQIVDAELAKASFMMDIGQAQDALDTVLLPLEQKYASNEIYKFDIYGVLSRAYREIGNPDKAQGYFDQIPSKGWDE